MKNRTGKFISFLLCAIVCATAVSAFVGCGFTNTDPDIPLDVDMTDKPELELMLQNSGMTVDELNAEPTAGLLEELTGYKVKYSQFEDIDASTELNILFANRTKYNAIKVTKAQYNLLMSKDALLNIKPALEKYGQDMLHDITEYSWNVVSRDGGIYGIPEGGPPTEGQQNVADTILFRYDQLMDEGFNLPETRDEFTAILRHFKQKYGANDPTYRPFTFSKDDSLIPAIAVSFGIYQEWVLRDDEWKFYIELPEYKQYMEYMTMLYNEGLIDLDAPSKDKANVIAKFGQGKAVAAAVEVWDIQKCYNDLKKAFPSTDMPVDKVKDNVLSAVKGFESPDGVKNRTFHAGGYSYVTVIPKYMYEQAAYTIDHLNLKIKEENFRRMMIGEENVHWIYSGGQYRVLDVPRFEAEKNQASFFATGINEVHYPEYFLCRLDGQVVKDFFLFLNENSDEEGTYSPLNFTSLLPFYDTKRITLEEEVRTDVMNMMFRDKNTNAYDKTLEDFYKGGGTKAKAEIKDWCKKNNWHY